MWNRDEMEGKADRVKGRIKNETGKVLDNDKLRDEGEVDEAVGTVQETVGRARRKVGEAIEEIGEHVKK
jgi:uncharacterized protein YjbJ (UPF0337 family)